MKGGEKTVYDIDWEKYQTCEQLEQAQLDGEIPSAFLLSDEELEQGGKRDTELCHPKGKNLHKLLS